jgi:hypothetical protein
MENLTPAMRFTELTIFVCMACSVTASQAAIVVFSLGAYFALARRLAD